MDWWFELRNGGKLALILMMAPLIVVVLLGIILYVSWMIAAAIYAVGVSGRRLSVLIVKK